MKCSQPVPLLCTRLAPEGTISLRKDFPLGSLTLLCLRVCLLPQATAGSARRMLPQLLTLMKRGAGGILPGGTAGAVAIRALGQQGSCRDDLSLLQHGWIGERNPLLLSRTAQAAKAGSMSGQLSKQSKLGSF